MAPPPLVTVALLADHPQLITAVGEMRWREWGKPPEPIERAWWVEVTGREAGREALPVTWVAIDAQGQALGAVGLGQFDIAERRDRSPWVLGMIVDPAWRSRGLGAQLMDALQAWAGAQGYAQAWVATSGRAVRFYQQCGWVHAETIDRPGGDAQTVLTRSLAR